MAETSKKKKNVSTSTAASSTTTKTTTQPKLDTLKEFTTWYNDTCSAVQDKISYLKKNGKDNPNLLQKTTDKIITSRMNAIKWNP